MQIEVTKNPTAETINKFGCRSWSTWEKEPSTFPWHYDEKETCLILDGKVTVTPDGGEPVEKDFESGVPLDCIESRYVEGGSYTRSSSLDRSRS